MPSVSSPFSILDREFIVHKLLFHSPISAPTSCSLLIDSRIAPHLPTDLPSQNYRTPIASDGTPCFEIKDAGPKGFGMFATRPIPAGALILVEHPAIVTPASVPLDPEARNSAYHALFAALPTDPRNELLTMTNCRSQDECPTTQEGIARTNGTAVDLEFPAQMAKDAESKEYGAVFLKINRSNHR